MKGYTQKILLNPPEIKGVTFSRNGLIFLRGDAILHYGKLSNTPLKSITPVALLYSILGVIKKVELRKIPISISGRTIYPVNSLLIPDLHSQLVINDKVKKIHYQGKFFSPNGSHDSRCIKVLGIAFDLLFEPVSPDSGERPAEKSRPAFPEGDEV